jgi:hypothetical protein
MSDQHRASDEAARFFALVFGLVCVALAGVVYVAAGPEYLIGVGVLAAIGVTYVGFFVFATARVCATAVGILTLGWWLP